jgi:predicted Fe-S protein YdhL (DUF1289 family)
MTLDTTPSPIVPDQDLVASPCIGVCTVDTTRSLCIGCLRTLQEIGAWRLMTLAEKRVTVAACAERAKTMSRRDKGGQPLP